MNSNLTFKFIFRVISRSTSFSRIGTLIFGPGESKEFYVQMR